MTLALDLLSVCRWAEKGRLMSGGVPIHVIGGVRLSAVPLATITQYTHTPLLCVCVCILLYVQQLIQWSRVVSLSEEEGRRSDWSLMTVTCYKRTPSHKYTHSTTRNASWQVLKALMYWSQQGPPQLELALASKKTRQTHTESTMRKELTGTNMFFQVKSNISFYNNWYYFNEFFFANSFILP